MGADGQEVDQAGQLVRKRPPVVEQRGCVLDGGLDACSAALCRHFGGCLGVSTLVLSCLVFFILHSESDVLTLFEIPDEPVEVVIAAGG
jgi:hypothetical protein